MRSLVDPGEAVGLLASQGIGEPSTQMTLNTFHLAGHGAANVTLGIPRLREIVMTAAQNPATPTMKLPLRQEMTDADIEAFIKQVSRLTLSQVIERVTVTERLAPRSAADDRRQRKYTVLIEFYPAEEYCKEYEITPEQVHESLAFSFSRELHKQIAKELSTVRKTLDQDQAVGRGLKVRGNDLAEDEDGEVPEDLGRRGRDDELDDDDEDSGQLKRARQSKQHEYEDDDPPAGSGGRADRLADLEDNIEQLVDSDDDDDEEDDEDMNGADPEAKALADKKAEALSEAFMLGCKRATEFSFDQHHGRSAQFDLEFKASEPKLLLVDIVERTCRASIVHEVANIGRCMKDFNDKGDFTRKLMTEGSNLQGMWSLADELVDLDKIESNDVYAILTTYGVEAARRSIIEEIGAVFSLYHIKVDYRHLTVIADYMTHAGGYRPFNRTGMGAKSSPFLKASFETTVAFLSEATLHGDFDDLSSPAGRIIMGQPSKNGTGSFDIRAPVRL